MGIQFTDEDVAKFSRVDWETLYGLKRSPMCNDTKHKECVLEIRDAYGTVLEQRHWMHSNVSTDIDPETRIKWPWCECLCHYDEGYKVERMRTHFPSFKKL